MCFELGEGVYVCAVTLRFILFNQHTFPGSVDASSVGE